MSEDAALLACPFCGGTGALGQLTEEANRGGWIVECIACQASTRVFFSVKEDARPLVAEAWNRRAALSAGPAPSREFERGLEYGKISMRDHASNLIAEIRGDWERAGAPAAKIDAATYLGEAIRALSAQPPAQQEDARLAGLRYAVGCFEVLSMTRDPVEYLNQIIASLSPQDRQP